MGNWLKKLKEKGYRTTRTRKEILRVLTFHPVPLTPRQIREEIPQRVPDLSTIYRDLTLFEELKIVESIFTPQGSFYEIKRPAHHSHLICPSCYQINCIPCPLRQEEYLKHQVIFWERCKNCKSQGREK